MTASVGGSSQGQIQRRIGAFVLLAGLVAAGLPSSAMSASAPPNDFFAFAKTVSDPLPYVDAGANTSVATKEAGEPVPSCTGITNTAWYKYVPSVTTTIEAVVDPTALTGNNPAPALAVYEGEAFDSFVQQGCTYAYGTSTVLLAFPVTAGHTYYFQVGSTTLISNGPSRAFDFTLIDAGAPTVTVPVVSLVAGKAIVSGSLPVTFSWTGKAGSSPIHHYAVEKSCDGGAWSSPATQTASNITINSGVPSHTCRVRVQAVDTAGRRSTRAVSASAKPVAYQNTSSAITYRGTWTKVSASVFSGGSAKRASGAGASATFKFTGRSVAWVGVRCSKCGSAKIYVNGVRVKTISLYATSSSYRRFTWTMNWSSSATRTVKIVVVGTSGHPRVFVDLFAKLS